MSKLNFPFSASVPTTVTRIVFTNKKSHTDSIYKVTLLLKKADLVFSWSVRHYPLRGSLACDWTPVAAGKLELLARETYGGCWSCRTGAGQKMTHVRIMER